MNKGQFIGRLSSLPHGAGRENAAERLGFHKFGFSGELLMVTSYLACIVLFLPAAGYRNGGGLNAFGQNGYYWSSVSASSTNAYNVNFNAGTFNAQNSNNRYNGFSVRLAVASALIPRSFQFSRFAAGWRSGGDLNSFGQNGYYWSSVLSSDTNAYNVNFTAGSFNAQNSNNRYNGRSVRLAVASALALRSIGSSRSAAGNRWEGGLNNFGQNGYYWSSVSSDASNAYNVRFTAGSFNAQNSNNRCNGFSVRLAVASALALCS